MPVDPLSDFLRVVRFSGGMFFRVELRAPFAVMAMDAQSMTQRFAPDAAHMLPFHLVLEGEPWFDIDGSDSVQLQPDDIIVLPQGADHVITDHVGRRGMHITEVQEHVTGEPPTLRYGGEGETVRALCGFFYCRSHLFNPLMDALPPVLVVKGGSGQASWLGSTLQRTFDETLTSRPGGAAMVERLTELLFVEVVQHHLQTSPPTGWLGGLADPVVSSALDVLHQKPGHSWTVQELARAAGASRSVLAERFSELVGLSPMKYLAAWRMELAAQRLMDSSDAIAAIAAEVGYDSEAAFNRAFKRHLGAPPATWRRAQQRLSSVE